VRQWSNLGAFVAALAQGNYELLARSMEDLIVEPARKSLIPKFEALKAASIKAGALGGGISGSGPSMFMLCENENIAKNVEEVMQQVYSQTAVEFKTYISSVNAEGIVFL
jgi:homoserine kinase